MVLPGFALEIHIFLNDGGQFLTFSLLQIVFSEAWWIGRKDDNPDENRLDTPPSLLEKRHTIYTFGAHEGGWRCRWVLLSQWFSFPE